MSVVLKAAGVYAMLDAFALTNVWQSVTVFAAGAAICFLGVVASWLQAGIDKNKPVKP